MLGRTVVATGVGVDGSNVMVGVVVVGAAVAAVVGAAVVGGAGVCGGLTGGAGLVLVPSAQMLTYLAVILVGL